ncbi:hypothetical protein POV27_16610 [Aureisphaera galaxeae]|uniref:hypothetical protein n=1 Tax=Aureisphaera galaxeae TaxID=1538023 RepID=UPI002350957C|nr:hypothetical protein [Aureisphaera galaxeae]MDC8005682.1 hypothetical protein [Aureisphaera galaxeae]
MKNRKLLVIWCLVLTLVGCQVTETLTLNEDGSGRISISMDMSEMMAFGGDLGDSLKPEKMDSIMSMKDILEEKKDSISKLPKKDQERLKKLENYSFRTFMDTETKEMFFDLYTDFKDIKEANDLMNAFESSGDFIPSMGPGTDVNSDPASGGIMAVNFSYKNGKFVRDAFIVDEEKHKMQMDSIKTAEGFMSSMKYKIKYTFPRRIKSISVEDARFSLDGKTVEFEKPFLDYFKDPDVLDFEVELED